MRFHPAALLAAARGRWRALFDRAALERELDEEVRFHLDMQIEQNLHAGMSPAQAHRAARIAFGGLASTVEAHRDARGTRFIEDAVADLRYAARALAHTPGFVVVSVLTLATAIAIGTLPFTAVNGFFYRPLPVPGGADLVAVFTSDYSDRTRLGASSYADIADFSKAVAPVAELAGEARVSLGVGASDNIVMTQGAVVSPGYFRLLRVTPELGRFPDEFPPGFPAVVLSYTLWRRTFNSDSSIIGRPIRVNGRLLTVVAVTSPEFRGTSREIADEFWIDGTLAPLVLPRDDFIRARGARRFHALARLRDEVSLEALNARLGTVASALFQAYPDTWRDTTGHGRVIGAMLERDVMIANIPRRDLLLVVGGVVALGLTLLAVASANLASLQIARGATRRREFATRLALGASRGRVVRQLLAECALLMVPGVLVGVGASVVVSRLVSHYRPIPVPTIDLSPDWRSLVFVSAALLLVLLVFGLVPALQTVRSDLVTDLRGEHPRNAGGIRLGGVRAGLIVMQVALSVTFTAVSSLIALALVHDATRSRDQARRVLIARVNFLPAAGDSIGVETLADDLIADISAIPGVDGASAADFIPIRGTRRTVEAEIENAGGQTRHLVLDANAVGPAYFKVVGLALLRGRGFEPRDGRAGNAVVIVSRAMADALWPTQDPIGRRITIGTRRGRRSAEVIGVVADPVGWGPATPESYPGLLYLHIHPMAEAELVLHVRAAEGQAAITGRMLERLRSEHARLAATDIMTLDRYYERMILPQRLIAEASGLLAVAQLLLAVAGLSGIVVFATALRRREIGIRMALGASRRSVLSLVMRQGIRLTAIGGAAGLALSLATSRVISASLPVTTPVVLGAFLLATVIFLAIDAIAMLPPAWRALNAAPADVLRVD